MVGLAAIGEFIDPYVYRYIQQTGLGRVFKIGYQLLDHALISALVERWRPETHTFYFPIGEATITLQDVQILWGLPINGDVVSGVWNNMTPDPWSDFAGQYLGIDVPPSKIKSGHILISASCAKLNEPVSGTDRSHQQRASIYFLAGLSSFLFPDGNSTSAPLNYVHHLIKFESLRWGSAVLAHVYRNLCCTAEKTDQSGINGAMLLVQHWLYERIPSLAPRLLHDIVLTSNAPLDGPYGVVRTPELRTYTHTCIEYVSLSIVS
ncbi:serine/threonine-protein phosphatase 7 long form homolog [Rutidosis leptorrhynchoides]|uniref:serine/threonine-protein phosphatase 7 long form homolog n=1 Tax=Rutidosis leptorrhynchoides TaxID=125765 RepID=UPI003A995AF8